MAGPDGPGEGAKLDQILPLLAGLTPIGPARYPPKDLEAIRIVVISELTELVNELGPEGGRHIQRVDNLFELLLGKDLGVTSNPDLVRGQLGTLRERFALTMDEVNTLDEERAITNFRIVVEQVLALRQSWIAHRHRRRELDQGPHSEPP